jgi:hypothetical protein
VLRLRKGMQIFIKTLTGKTPNRLSSGCISDQFPTRGTVTTLMFNCVNDINYMN